MILIYFEQSKLNRNTFNLTFINYCCAACNMTNFKYNKNKKLTNGKTIN